MTVELDKLVKAIGTKEITLELEQDGDITTLYIGSHNNSGCEYTIHSIQDISESLLHFLNTFI